MPLSFGTRSVIVVPAKAGTYIPEAVVIGPQHKLFTRVFDALCAGTTVYELTKVYELMSRL